ncbi:MULTISPECIES: branched-chain amino acid ABC transporter permease [unclassified Bradyrhizobium]|uniref:branched-chain amino acid ABC transporter permease n=1 Tax=unclassified Bradyrhizobium TaxID=2631580 RepID=UPI001CD6CDDB|nr:MULTISPECIES: branched-chain amino acid ABC transporter permease [unclassified Bradyrhizobium]MCA1388551.1 branched-chain amino acid ABC transporter permease [Bradyrhizobium sp. IC3123]MCA1414019.1 branched-chain amino acid ABC transporter permease [Bradyrhizobium sp. NBAIM20]MCA1463552.1 branched-chain amino acid ABC transporter permease [Bradyrhizobium sp. NBAIM18]MCA1470285.1 branched-chain amino acid ABC transporter permease [Bradyrhizobium sp. IC3195]MCA1474636.1 branched-chain amino a
MLLVDIILPGLVLGGMYALIALGLTLQYGVARIMNLSYGESLVAAAFGAFSLYGGLGLSPLAALLLAVPVAMVLNWLLYRLLLERLMRRGKDRGAQEIDSILVTFGVLFVIQGAMLVAFGGQYYSYSYLSIPLTIMGSTLAVNRLVALLFAALVGGAVYLALTRTRIGTAVRAIAVDANAARLVGIDVAALSGLAFAFGGGLVAVGGVLISMFLTFNAAMGVVFTMKALVVVIMGGVGNVIGALVAGLLLGVVETAVARLVDPGLTLAATYALFLGVLVIKPTGLFGRAAS